MNPIRITVLTREKLPLGERVAVNYLCDTCGKSWKVYTKDFPVGMDNTHLVEGKLMHDCDTPDEPNRIRHAVVMGHAFAYCPSCNKAWPMTSRRHRLAGATPRVLAGWYTTDMDCCTSSGRYVDGSDLLHNCAMEHFLHDANEVKEVLGAEPVGAFSLDLQPGDLLEVTSGGVARRFAATGYSTIKYLRLLP